MHVSEYSQYVVICREKRGTSPIRLLAQLGVLNDAWNLIHVVAIDQQEVELIAKHNTSVIHYRY